MNWVKRALVRKAELISEEDVAPLYAGYKVVAKYILTSESPMNRTNNDQMEWL